MKAMKQPVDLGSVHRHKHNRAKPQLTGRGKEFRLRIVDSTAIDRALLKDLITPDQYQVLERFSDDLYRADLMGLKASDFQPRVTSGTNQDLAQDVALRRAKVNEIILHLDDSCGRKIRSLVMSMCLDELDPHPSRGLDLLKGIEALFSYYE